MFGLDFERMAAGIRRLWRYAAVSVLFFFSGASGLIYQVIWTRRLVLLFGTTAYAVSAVLAVYFVGLGVGSLLGGRVSDRLRKPLLWYGVFEVAIGLWAMAFPAFATYGESAVVELLRVLAPVPHAGVVLRALLSLGFLAVPVTLMGATLPLLARFAAAGGEARGLRIGVLYSINTFGAVAGCAAAGFWLLPALGYAGATFVGAGINAAIGLIACALSVGGPAGAPVCADEHEPSTGGPVRACILGVFGVSGACALALEVIWTRLLTVVFLGTTYAFTTMLVSLLCGLAVGSAVAAAVADRLRVPLRALGMVEGLIGAACIGFLPAFASLPARLQAMQLDAGYHWEGIVRAKFILSFFVLFVPTFLFGATFPLAVRAYRRAGVGTDVGRLYSINTMGGVAGSLAGGFVLIPWLGAHGGIVAIGWVLLAAGLLLVAVCGQTTWAGRAIRMGVLVLMVSVALYRAPHDVAQALNAAYIPRGDHVLHMREGVEGVVAVSEPEGNRSGSNRVLWINGVQATASIEKGVRMNRFQGVLPLLFDRDPRQALFMCFGSGVTAGTLALHGFDRIDAVEISRDVLGAAHWFAADNRDVLSNPRVRFVVDDGRNYLLTTRQSYDLITFEPMPLALAGVSTFYTREYYRLCLAHLAPGGLVSQWVPLHSLNPDIVRSLTATFAEVFPECCAWFINADLFLIGSNRPLHIDFVHARERLAEPAVAEALAEAGLNDPIEILSCFFMTREGIRRYVDGAAIMTDGHPWAEFVAPKLMYERTVDKTLEQLEPFFETPTRLLTAPGLSDADTAAVAVALDTRHRAKEAVLKGLKSYYGGSFGGRPETDFEKALAIDAGDRTASYYLKEITLARVGVFRGWKELDKAVAAVEEALHAAPGLVDLKLILGDLYFDQHRAEDARQVYQAYLDAGGTEPRARERLQ